MTLVEIKQHIYSIFNDVTVLIDQIRCLSTDTSSNDIDITSLGMYLSMYLSM
jgi:hypothetical protein